MNSAQGIRDRVWPDRFGRPLPFLEQVKAKLPDPDLRLDFGVRKFDVTTGEAWSLDFRVLNTRARRASHYYIIDLSALVAPDHHGQTAWTSAPPSVGGNSGRDD